MGPRGGRGGGGGGAENLLSFLLNKLQKAQKGCFKYKNSNCKIVQRFFSSALFK